jgi:hypothetical protein
MCAERTVFRARLSHRVPVSYMYLSGVLSLVQSALPDDEPLTVRARHAYYVRLDGPVPELPRRFNVLTQWPPALLPAGRVRGGDMGLVLTCRWDAFDADSYAEDDVITELTPATASSTWLSARPPAKGPYVCARAFFRTSRASRGSIENSNV